MRLASRSGAVVKCVGGERVLANSNSAEKRARVARRRTLRNQQVKSRVRTFIRRFEETLDEGNREVVEEALRQAISNLDRAAQKGVIHRNQVARKKSKLVRRYNQLAEDRA